VVLEAAARPLIERGVALAVIAAPSGDESGADFTRRLDAAGLLRAGRIAPDAIALYISFAPRYSELRAGTDWSARLPNEALREIRLDILNPALRSGAASDGVAAALAALDARLGAGPFGGAASRWLWFAGAVVLLILASSTLRGWLSLARSGWEASPPGRLVARLWDHSPPGRALARRRLAGEIDRARRRLARSAAAARHGLADGTPSTADLVARLEQLDRREAALAQRTMAEPDLPPELDALGEDYRRLSVDIAARLRELGRWSASLLSAAKAARGIVERVSATFQGASKSRHPRAKRATKLRRVLPDDIGSKRREISEAGQLQIAALRGACQQLDRQRAGLGSLGLSAPDLVERQQRLAGEYDALRQAAIALWQAEAPWAYQAYLAAQASASAAAGSASEAYSSYTETSYASGSSADISSSSDYSGSSDYGSSSQPSSDGGSW
jgi:hypothetical protein